MIITIIGTQNIGKTTTVKAFLETYKDFTCPKLDYRNLIEQNNLKINREGNNKSQQMILDFIINDLQLQKQKNENIIIDRSCIDAYVYGLWHFNNRPIESEYDISSIRFQFEQMKENVKLYDHIFYIPLTKNPCIKIEDDKFRDTDPEYRAEIDKLFSQVIQSLGINFNLSKVHELYGSTEQRLEQMKNALKL